MEQLGSWYSTVAPDNDYRYNGKELNDDYGIGLHDYGARWYDAAIGRFTGVDPIADKFPHLSVYNYAGNGPISNIDLWGLQPVSVINGNRFTKPAAHLLSKVSGIDRAILLERTIVQKRAPGKYRPWYSANKKGGGAITLGNGAYFNITYTENWFDNNTSSYNGHGYGKNVWKWLNLSAHEVGHIPQNISEGGFFSYVGEFIYQYVASGNHDGAPYEEEAEESAKRFRKFDAFVNKNYGQNALTDLFKSNLNDNLKINKIDKWWNAFEESQGKQKKKGFNELLNNFQNLEEGNYKWNGTSWEKQN